MFKFRTIGQIEHGEYPFEDAVVEKSVLNGAFGDVADGKFTANDSGKKVIMQVENGDDAGLPEYKIPAGSHVRVLDLAKLKENLKFMAIHCQTHLRLVIHWVVLQSLKLLETKLVL